MLEETFGVWKTSNKLETLLTHLSHVFIDLFEQHRGGSQPFARFLVSWYESLGRVACPSMSDKTSHELWQQLSGGVEPQASTITNEDRSALVFDVGASCYTFRYSQVLTCICVLISIL